MLPFALDPEPTADQSNGLKMTQVTTPMLRTLVKKLVVNSTPELILLVQARIVVLYTLLDNTARHMVSILTCRRSPIFL